MDEMIDPEDVCTLIMSLPSMYHGDVGGTRDEYCPALEMKSLYGSPSSSIVWRRSLCGRLRRRAGDDGGARRGSPSSERR